MKKSILIYLFLSLISSVLIFPQTGIKFTEGNWKEVKEKALSENKIIMVDVFADWCQPCKWMDKEVFTNDTVAEFYNSNFINWHIDAEKGEGVDFAKQYDVNLYPTFLFIDGNGNIVHRSVGAKPAGEFIQTGKTALDPELSLNSFRVKYDNGERSLTFLKAYLNALGLAYIPSDKIAEEYFEVQPAENWVSAENFEIIEKHINSSDNKIFEFFLKNKNKFSSLVDSNKVNGKIYNTYYNDIYSKLDQWTEADLESFFKKAESSGINMTGKFRLINWINFYERKNDWPKYADSVVILVEKYTDYNDKAAASSMLNNYAFNFYEHISSKKMLKKALGWAKKSVELDENYYNLDTYGCLFFKLKDRDNAIKYFEKAIEKAKISGDDSTPTKQLLEEAKKMK